MRLKNSLVEVCGRTEMIWLKTFIRYEIPLVEIIKNIVEVLILKQNQ